MKISKIQISNFIGIARADLQLREPVLVVAAENAQGKSSIADAISMAFTGKPRRVDVKKDLAQLLHNDAAKGRVSIEFGGADEGAEFRLPKGETSCSEIPNSQFIPFVLDQQLFSSMASDARRVALFDLTGCKASGKLVTSKLEARGLSEAMIDEVVPMLRGGFPAAEKECKSRATQAKGAWRQITGQNWGSVVADGWEAEKPEGKITTSKEMDDLLEAHKKIQFNLNQGIEFVGEQAAKLEATAAYVARRQAARDLAELLERRKNKLAVTEKDLAAWEEKLKPLQAKLDELKTASMPLKCPCCSEELTMVGGALEKFAGLKQDTKALSDAALAVTNAKSSTETLRKVRVNDIRDVADSEAAVSNLKKIEAEEIDMVDEDRLERSRLKVDELRVEEARARAEFNAKQQLRADAEAVDKTTQQAADAHLEVSQWLQVAEAFSPEGIPAELLASAIQPVNQSLAILARLSKWLPVEIRDDMSITYGGRLYGLCSESERWRADASITLAIAQISELSFAVLDRFDVLDTPSRTRLVGFLRTLTNMNSMDTVIICGTMKGPMNKVEGIDSVWLENGIAELNQ